MRAAGCMPAVGAKRVQNVVNAIEKWVPFTPKFSQRRWLLGPRPRPPKSEGGRLRRLPVLQAELKMVLTQFKNGFHSHPKCSQIALVAGAPPLTPPLPFPNSKGKRFRHLSVWHVELKMVLKAIQKWIPFTPKNSKKRWQLGLRPRPLTQ